MEVITLLGLIVAIIFIYMLCSQKEFFTPNPYIISWHKPLDDGGDEGCCNYDWQVCTDASCATIVDSGKAGGTGSVISVQTTKLDWNTTYVIRIQASNMFGPGEWASASLSTGDGVLSSIRFAEVFDASGNIVTPISAGLRNVSIWSSMNQGSESPNTFKASALVVVKRAGNNVLQQRLELSDSYDAASKSDIFSGNFVSQGISRFNFEIGDVLSATIIVWKPEGGIITEGSGDMTISQGVPNGVSGITLSYQKS